MSETESAKVRARQGFPTVDADAHILEYHHVVMGYFRDLVGEKEFATYQKWEKKALEFRWSEMTPETRAAYRAGRPQWFATAGGRTEDRAVGALPDYRRQRMDDSGIDFSVLFPSLGLGLVNSPSDEYRGQLCRAYNTMVMDMYGPHKDRMTPVALVPMYNPDEAIAELEYAVNTLGLKAAKLANFVIRPIPALKDAAPEIANSATYFDTLALDSEYDYDPVWAKCVELKIAPMAHNTTFATGMRRSPTSFMYNHCGHFAEGGEMFAKALFFGGVTKRFPELNFAFLEGGVAWAGILFDGLVSRWKKRNRDNIMTYDARTIDYDLMQKLFDEYAGDAIRSRTDPSADINPSTRDWGLNSADYDNWDFLDEFAACGVGKPEDIIELFAKPFYFGCEADDPYVGVAMSGMGMPWNTPMQAVFGSDIGHWDITDMTEVLEEAHEAVDDGLMSEDSYRKFVMENPVRLFGKQNPDFFKGTVVEQEAAAVLAGAAVAAE